MRLFHGAPWLRDHVLGLITKFAAGIHIDMDRIETIAQDLDPMDPSGIQDALASGVFSPQMTPDQEATLARLETVLALIEGWVTRVTVASTANIPSAAALTEMMARRRAEGGPAERTFGSLVGLELRPRRMREATAFWEHMENKRGIEERDGLWESAELLPTNEDLDDPEGFEQRRGLLTASDDEMDAALAKLLAGGYEGPDGGDATGSEDAGTDSSDSGSSHGSGDATESGESTGTGDSTDSGNDSPEEPGDSPKA